MIVITAQMWPKGSQAEAREILNMTLTNQGLSPDGGMGDKRYTYFGHVITRPYDVDGFYGYEADVEVRDHKSQDGCVPLIVSALAAANIADPATGFYLPPSKRIAFSAITTLDDFDKRLRGRS